MLHHPHYKCDILSKSEAPCEREQSEVRLQLTWLYSMVMPPEDSQASLFRPPTAHPPRISSPAMMGQQIYLMGGQISLWDWWEDCSHLSSLSFQKQVPL